MLNDIKTTSKNLTLAIHSTDDSFGFASRKDKNDKTDIIFIKKFDKDLCTNLIVDFEKFINKEVLTNVQKIAVSIGPGNFNASRLTVVLARTISQQKNCQLDGLSTFKLMAKRIALKNNIFTKDKTFWIYKKLKRRGFIAGKYEVIIQEQKNRNLVIREKVVPQIFQELIETETYFKADYNDKKDLKELLNLSSCNVINPNYNSWEKVLPLYPISPTN